MNDVLNPSCVLVFYNFYKTIGYLEKDPTDTTFISFLPYVYSFLISEKEARRNENFLAIKPFISHYFIEKTSDENKNQSIKICIYDRIPFSNETIQGRPVTLGFGDFIRVEPPDSSGFTEFFIKEANKQYIQKYPTAHYKQTLFDVNNNLQGLFDPRYLENKNVFHIPYLSFIASRPDRDTEEEQFMYPEEEYLDLQDLLSGLENNIYAFDNVSKFVLKQYAAMDNKKPSAASSS